MLDLDHALVARACGPIGRHVCRGLAQQGVDVAVHFEQDAETAEEIAEAVRQEGRSSVTLAGRLGDAMVPRNLVRKAAGELGGLDALVVAPRTEPIVQPDQDLDGASRARGLSGSQLEAILQADLKGPMTLAQRAAEAMGDEGPRAVLVQPGASLRSGAAGAGTRIASAGLSSFAESASQLLDGQARVNAVRPGLLAPEDVDVEALDVDAERLVSAEEVAAVAVHLLGAPPRLSGEVVDVGEPGAGTDPRPGGDSGPLEGLPGIERRVEPPDPEDRIDVD